MTERGLAEVGAMVAVRRTELSMSRSQLAQYAGVAVKTLLSFESGTSWPRPATRTRIETALGWPVGTLAAMRSGEVPPPGPGVADDVPFAELDDQELWHVIDGGHLDARRRRAALAEYERRQIDLLPHRLSSLSRRGLVATSRYVSILLETDATEGFRRESADDALADERAAKR